MINNPNDLIESMRNPTELASLLSTADQTVRDQILKTTLKSLVDGPCQVVDIVLNMIGQCEPQSCLDGISFILAIIKEKSRPDARLFEFLPQLVAALERESVCFTTHSEQPSLKSIKDALLRTISGSEWNTGCTKNILMAVREMNPSAEMAQRFLDRISTCYASLDNFSKPEVFEQFLLLGKQVPPALLLKKLEFIWGSCTQVATENAQMDAWKMTQGLLLMQLAYSFKQDSESAKELLAVIRQDQTKLQKQVPLLVLMSVTAVPNMKQSVLDFLLKSVIERCSAETKRSKTTSQVGSLLQSLLFDLAAKCSFHGWEQISECLLILGFLLLNHSSSDHELVQMTRKLGLALLVNIAKISRDLCHYVVDRIFNDALEVRECEANFELLDQLIAQDLFDLNSEFSTLRDFVHHIYMTHPSSAKRFLESIIPLSRSHKPLMDTLLLTLRKGVFHREEESRRIALTGFIAFLATFVPDDSGPSSSQAPPKIVVDPLLAEIMSHIRRFFTQEAHIRSKAYSQLDAIATKIPSLNPIVLDLLSKQATAVLKENPVQLVNDCFVTKSGNVIEMEPVYNLVFAFGSRLAFENVQTDTVNVGFIKMIQKLAHDTSKTASEQYGLDKTTDFSGKDANSENALVQVHCVLGLQESLIGVCFQLFHETFDQKALIRVLLQHYVALKKLVVDGLGKQPLLKAAMMHPLVIPLQGFLAITSNLFRSSTEETDLTLFALHGLAHRIKDTTEKSTTSLSFEMCSKLCHLMYSQHVTSRAEVGDRTIILASLECFEEALKAVPFSMMGTLVDSLTGESGQESGLSVLKNIKRRMGALLMKGFAKEAAGLIRISTFLTSNRVAVEFAMPWIRSLLATGQWDESIDVSVARDILAAVFQHLDFTKDPKELHYFISDLVHEFGKIEMDDEDLETERHFEIVAPMIAQQLIKYLDHQVSDLEWALNHWNYLIESRVSDEHDQTLVIYQKLKCAVTLIGELETLDLPSTQFESIVSLLSKTFKTLLLFVRRLSSGNIPLKREPFTSLLTLVSSSLTTHMYDLIMHIQMREKDTAEESHEKKKKRKREVKVKSIKGRSIPALIYQVEQFERNLIQLGKKIKLDMSAYVRRSTVRDFKIDLKENEEPEEDEEV